MAEELDLYGTGINWKKAIAIVATVSLIVTVFGFFGYRWLTNVTPVSRDKALEMFEKESSQAAAAESSDAGKQETKNSAGKKSGADDKDGGSKTTGGSSGSGGGGSSPKNDQTAVAAGTESTSSSKDGSRNARSPGYRYPTTPDEGVYSWATDGWEEASGIRRQFPKESQRIITASNGSSWKQHHYFSEEREIWSEFVITDKGAHMAMQRNRAKFGPVTNVSTVDFSPPMLVGLPDPTVGDTWNGKWDGKTYGSYVGRIADRGRMTIGGESLEVWVYELRIELKGELEGTVLAEVTFSPKYALTVQEHYRQELESDKGPYRAEWKMTLKSTTPQT